MAHTDINSEDRLVQATLAVHLEEATIITESDQWPAISPQLGIGNERNREWRFAEVVVSGGMGGGERIRRDEGEGIGRNRKGGVDYWIPACAGMTENWDGFLLTCLALPK